MIPSLSESWTVTDTFLLLVVKIISVTAALYNVLDNTKDKVSYWTLRKRAGCCTVHSWSRNVHTHDVSDDEHYYYYYY